MPKHFHGMQREQVAKIVRRRLMLLISPLIILLLTLLFRIAESIWPWWISVYRLRMVGILSLILIFLIALSPVMIEATSNTRHLSGPGKNPKTGTE